MKQSGFLDIVLLMRLSKGSGRDILHGFSTATRRLRVRWSLTVLNIAADTVRRALAPGVDGVVAHGLVTGVEDAFASFPGPLVYIGQVHPALANRCWPTAFVHVDDEASGRMGAEFLMSLGRFRTWGFVSSYGIFGLAQKGLAQKRLQGFRNRLAEKGFKVAVLENSFGPNGDERLVQWLRSLPRPIAVMAEQDSVALAVLKAASRIRLRVPGDLALVGVDNDELLCETSEPTLASIAVDHQRLGALAAEALRRLLADGNLGRLSPMVPPTGVVERQSARPVIPGTALAERAVAFIRRNATEGIAAADVAAHLGVSRRLADLRFRQATGESILGMILRLRLEAVKRKLAETDMAIGQITASCGFHSETRAKHLFKERFGCSMREWRRLNRR